MPADCPCLGSTNWVAADVKLLLSIRRRCMNSNRDQTASKGMQGFTPTGQESASSVPHATASCIRTPCDTSVHGSRHIVGCHVPSY